MWKHLKLGGKKKKAKKKIPTLNPYFEVLLAYIFLSKTELKSYEILLN